MIEEEATEAAKKVGYYVGDRWRNPRGRVYRIVRFIDEDRAVVENESSAFPGLREDTALYLRMHPANGWTKL